MKATALLFIVLLAIGLISCGDEGVILDTPIPYDTAPSAPSLIPDIPLSAVTHLEGEYESPSLIVSVYASPNGMDYVATINRYIGYSGDYTESDVDDQTKGTFYIDWTVGENRVDYRFYTQGNISYSYFTLDVSTRSWGVVGRTVNPSQPDDPPTTPTQNPVTPVNNPIAPVASGQIQILGVSQRGESFTFNMRLLDREVESYVISCGDAVPRRITYNQHPNEPYNEHGSWFGKGTPGKAGYLDLVPYDTYTIRVEVMDDPNISDELTFRYDDHKHGADADLVDQVKQQGGKTWHTHGSGWHSHGVGNHNYDSDGNYVEDE